MADLIEAIPTARSCVDLAEKVTATFYDAEYEEWTEKTVTIADILDTVCDAYTILPSAEPERKTVAEERYEDLCEYFRNDEDAIKAILHDRKEFKAWLERMHWHVTECDKMGRELEAQKSKRKPGRWERHYSRPGVFADLFWHCSCCGYKNDNQYANVYHKFCPNCGADMREETE